MRHGLAHLLAVSAVVMGMSHTIAKERIFLPLRERLGGKDTWFGYLVSCPYCASHWLAFLLVPVTGAYYVSVSPRLGSVAPLVEWFLSSILVVVVAAFLRVGFWLVDEQQGLIKRRQRTEEEVAATRRVARTRLERDDEVVRSDPH
jgi:uncharacterized protein DUF1360